MPTMDAAAIVVGINEYHDPVPRLTGSVADAEQVAHWLVSIGVPPGRIVLHIGGSREAPPTGVIVIEDASRDAIWRTFYDLQNRQATGEILFVFMAGHGYYLSQGGPIFIAQDWDYGSTDKNFALNSYAEFCRSLGFARTLFFVDACQNKDVDDIYRSKIRAGEPGVPFTPNTERGTLLCCATKQGQYAPVVDGSGLYTRRFLQMARNFPETIRESTDSNVYDWTTGRVQLDVRKLLDNAVAAWVQREAEVRGHKQNPTQYPFGQMASEAAFIIHAYQFEQLADILVDAGPLAAVEEVNVTLASIAPMRRLFPETDLPFKGRVPLHRSLHGHCLAREGWSSRPQAVQASPIQAQVTWKFDLVPPDVPTEGDSTANYNLTVIGEDGKPSPDLTEAELAMAGVRLSDFTFKNVGLSVGLGKTISGIDLRASSVQSGASQRAAYQLRDKLGSALRKKGIRRQITITKPGNDPLTTLPNVHVVVNAEAARTSYLASEKLVSVEQLRDGPAIASKHSIDRFEKHPWMRLSRGVYRLKVEFPWGSAQCAFDVGEGGEGDSIVEVELPFPVGGEPLRNRYKVEHAQANIWSTLVTQAGGRLSVRNGNPSKLISRIPVPADAHILAELDESGLARAEPYSTLPWKEWDLIMSEGRFEDVDLAEAVARLSGVRGARKRADTNIFALGLAYVALARGEAKTVAALIERLSPVFLASPDARMLLNAISSKSQRLAEHERPFFRWSSELSDCETVPRPISSSVWAVYRAENTLTAKART